MAKERSWPGEPADPALGRGQAVSPEPPGREVVTGERTTWNMSGDPGGSPAGLDRPAGARGAPDDATVQGPATSDARLTRGQHGRIAGDQGGSVAAEGNLPIQGDVPGVRGSPSQDLGGEPVENGPIGDEGGAGAHPGGPTFSERTYPTTHRDPHGRSGR
jgi:hypothetical protein